MKCPIMVKDGAIKIWRKSKFIENYLLNSNFSHPIDVDWSSVVKAHQVIVLLIVIVPLKLTKWLYLHVRYAIIV